MNNLHFHGSAYIRHLETMGLKAAAKLPLASQFDYGLCKDTRYLYMSKYPFASVCIRRLSNMVYIAWHRTCNRYAHKTFKNTKYSFLSRPFLHHIYIYLFFRFMQRVWSSCHFFGGCIHLRIILQCHSNSSNINKILDRFLNIFIYDACALFISCLK